jgi:hypothetical protein
LKTAGYISQKFQLSTNSSQLTEQIMVVKMKTKQLVPGIALITILVTGFGAHAENVDLSGFEVMTPNEFLELTAGKAFAGIHRGQKYAESYTRHKTVHGEWGGTSFSGHWTAGENNCVMITYTGSSPQCWKLFHKDGKYAYGEFNRSGEQMVSSHKVTFID